MLKKITLITTLLFACHGFSQSTFQLSGKIIDNVSKAPLESATIYLTSVKDSTIIDYTISDKSGNFYLKSRKTESPVNFKVSYNGFQNYNKKIDNILADKDFGSIEMFEQTAQLNEVVVKGEIPPIQIKTDTLEFNAGSFKVGPDANVEKLLKQLPGVEIDDEGKITVNGKEVKNILVNGKPFFGKDGKIATQNLPADMIDKVQVSDTKTKAEEISGRAASSNESTINLTIQEDKNKGMFGKAILGYGSDKRYESSLLFNYFKDTQKISILGSANNINSVGFSMNEIFDNMGGGRNSSVWVNDSGSFNINGMQFGGGSGITRSNLVGINYADEWFNKKVDPNFSYYLNTAITENKNRTKRTNLLPTGTTKTDSESSFKNDVVGHNFSSEFEIKIDSTSTLYLMPSFSKSDAKNRSTSFSKSFDVNDDLLNETNGSNFNESDNNKFKNSLYYNKSLKKKGRAISVNIDNEHSNNNNTLNTITNTVFYQSGNADDIRNQNVFDKESNNDLRLELGFNEPISDSLTFNFQNYYDTKKGTDSRNTFNFNASTNQYDTFNDLLSNTIDSKNNTFGTSVGLQLNKSKLRGSISLGADFLGYENQANYLGTTTRLKDNYVYPNVNGYMSYKIAKSKSIYTNFNYEASLPSANQLLPFENLANPLNTIIGNANLKPRETYRMYNNFNNYDYATRSGFYTYFGGNLTTNDVVSSTVYDSDFKAVTTYENVDKSYSMFTGFNVNKSYNKEKRTIKYGYGIWVNYNFNQGLTNLALYESRALQLNPRVNFSYIIQDKITITPSYKYSYNITRFDNYIIDKTDNFKHSFKLETTSYWPKNVVLGNDFGYNYNSNITGGFQKDFYLWNVSLGYNFFKDQLLAKVKVYDLLNQNVNATRSISPTSITDSENTVLQQYVMFSLTYKLEKFGGKKKNDNGIFFD
ncbi:outer membrane beta-barrel protein [uncultured Flavobacterium sp.]|uniref:outer membrane beta-barrel protein n=1 Tax=uncultured Flavobacterium sp. TaxID=165435 RepID=UPI0030EB7490|tara:strand:- start:32346 stop:35129 length:2784 start_codon:yes stop_codon:yes gene_type:complete